MVHYWELCISTCYVFSTPFISYFYKSIGHCSHHRTLNGGGSKWRPRSGSHYTKYQEQLPKYRKLRFIMKKSPSWGQELAVPNTRCEPLNPVNYGKIMKKSYFCAFDTIFPFITPFSDKMISLYFSRNLPFLQKQYDSTMVLGNILFKFVVIFLNCILLRMKPDEPCLHEVIG